MNVANTTCREKLPQITSTRQFSKRRSRPNLTNRACERKIYTHLYTDMAQSVEECERHLDKSAKLSDWSYHHTNMNALPCTHTNTHALCSTKPISSKPRILRLLPLRVLVVLVVLLHHHLVHEHLLMLMLLMLLLLKCHRHMMLCRVMIDRS